VGFTAANGAASEAHDIVNWTFADTATMLTNVPEPETAWIVALGLAGLEARKRAGARRS
jgi:hypothetical protein